MLLDVKLHNLFKRICQSEPKFKTKGYLNRGVSSVASQSPK